MFSKIALLIAVVLIVFGIISALSDVSENYFDSRCSGGNDGALAKPIIYLYPEYDTEIEVKLGNAQLLTTTYPLYNDGWEVIAKPDGTLIAENREFYSLYYESDAKVKPTRTDEGFVVAKDDLVPFLEEKLAVLGLNDREANEFIIYWLPVLEQNKYCYIRFASAEEIEEQMPLEITPKPDTIIRVLMYFDGLSHPITVNEQNLQTPTRDGFTVVEWGGSEIKSYQTTIIRTGPTTLIPSIVEKMKCGDSIK